MSYTRAFGPKANLVYARSITASQVNAVTPAGLKTGGDTWRVYNSSSTIAVIVLPYNNARGTPTLVFPIDGGPPTGEPGVLVAPGQTVNITGFADSDSFAAIGSAAGPSLIYVQRGDYGI